MSFLSSKLLTQLPLVLIVSASLSASSVSAVTDCVDRAHWLLLGLPKSAIATWFDPAFHVDFYPHHPFASQLDPLDQHPVLFEFNHQQHCIPEKFNVSVFAQDFLEWKYEIPYVTSAAIANTNQDYTMLKPILYENAIVDTIGSRIAFGLNAFEASIQADFGIHNPSFNFSKVSFNVFNKDKPMIATFNDQGPTTTSDPTFQPFIEIAKRSWLCGVNNDQCAYNQYNWDTTSLRKLKLNTLQVGTQVDALSDPLTYTELAAFSAIAPFRIIDKQSCSAPEPAWKPASGGKSVMKIATKSQSAATDDIVVSMPRGPGFRRVPRRKIPDSN